MTNQDLQPIVKKINSFDFTKVLAKYQAVYDSSSEQAEDVLSELKKWFAICAASPETKYHIGSRVDDMWHVFILFTRDYSEFCQRCLGFFLHHEPNIVEEKNQTAESNERLFVDYEKYFLQKPPANIWPRYHSMPGEGGNPRPCHCIYMPR